MIQWILLLIFLILKVIGFVKYLLEDERELYGVFHNIKNHELV